MEFARRSAILRTKFSESSRFATISRKRMLEIVGEVEKHNVVSKSVRSTIPWLFGMRLRYK